MSSTRRYRTRSRLLTIKIDMCICMGRSSSWFADSVFCLTVTLLRMLILKKFHIVILYIYTPVTRSHLARTRALTRTRARERDAPLFCVCTCGV